MFLPNSSPLKEGRSVSSRRSLRLRHVALVIGVVLFLRAVSLLCSGSSGPLCEISQEENTRDEDGHIVAGHHDKGGRISGERFDPGFSDHISGQARLVGHSQGESEDSSRNSELEHFSRRPGFDDALARITNLLPGDFESRALLGPIGLTGEMRLREFGIRARTYKRLLEAWEELHLISTPEGDSYVRDDVVQYLRSQRPITGTADDAGESNQLADTIHAYDAYRRLLGQLGQLLFPYTAPFFPDHMTLHSHLRKGGRGIVLTAGNDQVIYLLIQIPILRKLGCNLPIEVMYVGDGDLDRDSRQDLEDLEGVVTRDIAAMVAQQGWNVASWAAKPFAILLSSFREAIFIDADSFFFVNPELLFDDPGYVRTGALFFRDRLIMPESKKSWLKTILPQPVSRNVKNSRLWTGQSGHQQESGVIVVDKYRHFMALLFVTRMNGPDRDGNSEQSIVGVYDMVYGDKETFWLGWELVGDTDYLFHQGDAGTFGMLETPPDEGLVSSSPVVPQVEGDGDGAEVIDPDLPDVNTTTINPKPLPSHKICSPQLLHLDREGKPLWFNGGLVTNKFLDKRDWTFGTWHSYLIEPRDVREPGAWFLGESNMCCLTTDHHLKGDLTRDEKALLAMMVEQARSVGVGSNR